jgi:hypothetical protein
MSRFAPRLHYRLAYGRESLESEIFHACSRMTSRALLSVRSPRNAGCRVPREPGIVMQPTRGVLLNDVLIAFEAKGLEKQHWLDQHGSQWPRPCWWPVHPSRWQKSEGWSVAMAVMPVPAQTRSRHPRPQQILTIACPTSTMAIRIHTGAYTIGCGDDDPAPARSND